MIEVKNALYKFLSDNKSVFDEAMEEFGWEIQKIYKYEKMFVEQDMYPNLMICPQSVGPKAWVASGYLLQQRFTIKIIGGLIHDDTEVCADAIEKFAFTLDRLFEQKRYEELPVEGKPYSVHYGPSNDPPITGYELYYEIVGDGQTFLRSFEADWVGYITRTADFEGAPQE